MDINLKEEDFIASIGTENMANPDPFRVLSLDTLINTHAREKGFRLWGMGTGRIVLQGHDPIESHLLLLKKPDTQELAIVCLRRGPIGTAFTLYQLPDGYCFEDGEIKYNPPNL